MVMWQRAVMLAALAVAGCETYGGYGDLYSAGSYVGSGVGYAGDYGPSYFYGGPSWYGGQNWWGRGECCRSRDFSPGELVARQHQFNTQLTAQQQLYNSQISAAQQRYNQQIVANPAATPISRQQLNAETSAAARQLQNGIRAARRLDFGH